MSVWRWLKRGRRERELEDEIAAHMAIAVRDRVERGQQVKDAELDARKEFGNRTLIEEVTREMWGWSLLQSVFQDLRYALRGMRRSPVFTTVAIISLALSIGANTAIFSLMNTVMLRLLPVEQPQQLVELLEKYPGEPRGNGYWSDKSYQYLAGGNHVFSELIRTALDHRVRIQTKDGQAEMGVGEYVSGNYFQVLGLRPAAGRMIGSEDATNPVAVLNWSYWDSRFQRDPAILGAQIVVQDKSVTIIGVAPRAFSGLRVETATDIWLPIEKSAESGLVGRLKPGANIDQARAEMAVLFRFTVEERAASSKDPQVRRLKIELEPAGAGLAKVRDLFGR